MKLNKKWSGIIAFCLGAVILTTSAIADTSAGSGYKNLKQALKDTAAFAADSAESYTVDYSLSLKWEDMVLMSSNETMKRDMVNNRSEQTSKIFDITYDEAEERTFYYYNDSNMSLTAFPGGEVNVNQYSTEQKDVAKEENPFEEEYMVDVENLVDAFIGSLSDTVYTESSEDKTMYIANIETTQIPAYLNALVAFFAKQTLDGYDNTNEYPIPTIKSDVYVKSANGKAVADESGILTNVVAQGIVMGKDTYGIENQFSLEVSYRMYDINQTVIELAEIPEDANVRNEDNSKASRYGFDKKSIGMYKRDIVDTSGDLPEKIGERELVVTAVTSSGVVGHYREIYFDSSKENVDIEFEAEAERNEKIGVYMCFEYVQDGEEKIAALHGDYQGLICSMDFYQSGSEHSSSSAERSSVSEYVELIRVFE